MIVRTLLFALLSCAQSLEVGPHCARLGRRAVLHSGLLVFPAAAALAAEPEPTKTLTDEEMAARVARKMELLKKQGAKGRGGFQQNTKPKLDTGIADDSLWA